MSEDLKAGDWVRRTIHARLDTHWCEGQVRDLMSGSVIAMTVVRAHNWPVAEEAMRGGRLFHPHGVGTLERIPPDILVGDHVMWTPPSDCPYYGLHLKGLVTAVVNDRPLIRVQTLYDSHFREIAIAEWPPNLRLGAVMDTGVAPGIVQRWPRLSEEAPPTSRPGCARCAGGNPGGGTCTGCGYPRAYAHPDCVSEAFDMDVVYVGGTAMLVTGCIDIPFGTVSIIQRDGSSQSHQIPLKAGDYVRWETPMNVNNWAEGEITATDGGRWFDIAIHAEGDSRDGRGGTQPFGLSGGCTVRRIPRPNPEPKPEMLLAGDYVRWDNPLFPAGQVWIEGELVLNPVNHARIRIDDFRGQGSEWSRGAHTDVRVEPGSLRRIPRPGVGLQPQREPMRDEVIKERYAQPDPLDVEYDGVRLRDLLNAQRQHDQGGYRVDLTAKQRVAISAYWSAALRAKIAASDESERNRVRVDLQDID